MRAKRHGRTMNRRQLLAYSGAFTATFAIGRHLAHAVDSPFTMGIASGEPSPDVFVMCTRLASEPLAVDGSGGMSASVSVMWEVATDDAMRNVVRSVTVEAAGRLAPSIHAAG